MQARAPQAHRKGGSCVQGKGRTDILHLSYPVVIQSSKCISLVETACSETQAAGLQETDLQVDKKNSTRRPP